MGFLFIMTIHMQECGLLGDGKVLSTILSQIGIDWGKLLKIDPRGRPIIFLLMGMPKQLMRVF